MKAIIILSFLSVIFTLQEDLHHTQHQHHHSHRRHHHHNHHHRHHHPKHITSRKHYVSNGDHNNVFIKQHLHNTLSNAQKRQVTLSPTFRLSAFRKLNESSHNEEPLFRSNITANTTELNHEILHLNKSEPLKNTNSTVAVETTPPILLSIILPTTEPLTTTKLTTTEPATTTKLRTTESTTTTKITTTEPTTTTKLTTTELAKVQTTEATMFHQCCNFNTTKSFNCTTNSFYPSCIVTSMNVAKDTNAGAQSLSHNVTSVLNLVIPTIANQRNKDLKIDNGQWSVFSNSSLDTKNSLFKYLNNISEEVLFVPKHLANKTAVEYVSTPTKSNIIAAKVDTDLNKDVLKFQNTSKNIVSNHSGDPISRFIDSKNNLLTNQSKLLQPIENNTTPRSTIKKGILQKKKKLVNRVMLSNVINNKTSNATGVTKTNKEPYMDRNEDTKQKTNKKNQSNLRMKLCKPKALNLRQLDMMTNPLEDYDVAEAGISCALLARRHLITTFSSKNETKVKTESTPSSKKAPNKDKVGTGTSYVDRQKELELIKYKILNDIYDQPAAETKLDDKNSFNKSIPIDPTLVQQSTEEENVDESLKDANLGIVGIDDHPAIDPPIVSNRTHFSKQNLKNKTEKNSIRKKVGSSKNITKKLKNKLQPKTRVKRILCFGDSLTRGYYKEGTAYHPYSDRLQQLFEKYSKNTLYEIINSGLNGECASTSMQTRLPDMIKIFAPLDMVIILAGTNDILGHCGNISNLFTSIQSLHEMALGNGLKTTVVTIPPVFSINGTAVTEDSKKILSDLNDKLRMYVDIHMHPDRIFLIDLADKFLHEDMLLKRYMWDDGVHFSPQGYDLAGEFIFNSIRGKV